MQLSPLSDVWGAFWGKKKKKKKSSNPTLLCKRNKSLVNCRAPVFIMPQRSNDSKTCFLICSKFKRGDISVTPSIIMKDSSPQNLFSVAIYPSSLFCCELQSSWCLMNTMELDDIGLEYTQYILLVIIHRPWIELSHMGGIFSQPNCTRQHSSWTSVLCLWRCRVQPLMASSIAEL